MSAPSDQPVDKAIPALTVEQQNAWAKLNARTEEERRALYHCKDNFFTLSTVLPWDEYVRLGQK
jgi:hypothetical protein